MVSPKYFKRNSIIQIVPDYLKAISWSLYDFTKFDFRLSVSLSV